MKRQVRRLVYLFLALVLSTGIMGYPKPPAARAFLWGGGQTGGTPGVTSISPTYGTAGTVVEIDGYNFYDDSLYVDFTTGAPGEWAHAPNFNVIDLNHIRATVPALPGGQVGVTVDVVVGNNWGNSDTSAYDNFTYVASPTITSISETSGSTAGGDPFIISGTNFQGATAVYFGNTPSPNFGVHNNGTAIYTQVPPGAAGTVNVTVVTPLGASPPSNAAQFTYKSPTLNWPTVTGVSPDRGPTSGGTTVTITGSKFTGATTVSFGSNIASFKVISDTSITAVSPPGSVMADVTVSTPNGTSAKSTADEFFYTYQLPNQKVTAITPTVTAITPNSGQAAGGTQVTITGTLFAIGQTVRFGSTAATAVTVNSTTSVTATSPAGTGTVDVTVTSSEGTSATSAGDQFTYTSPTTPAPTVTGISPSSGPTAGGTAVTITGTNFASGATVGFGGTAATGVTFNSPTAITATSPAGTGMVDVTVTTTGGTSATSSADQFTFTPAAPPPAPTGQIVMRFYIGNTDYYVNNQVQSMDIAPVIINSRTLLPIRYVATPLGAAVSWDQAAQKVTVALNGTTIELWIGQNTATVNGVATPIDSNNPDVTPVIMPPGRTMLPLRFIAENLGSQVDWNQAQQMVTVTYPKP